ncbi:hypothetical protein RQP46_010527 [Phenoliferia psychrophenolica]
MNSTRILTRSLPSLLSPRIARRTLQLAVTHKASFHQSSAGRTINSGKSITSIGINEPTSVLSTVTMSAPLTPFEPYKRYCIWAWSGALVYLVHLGSSEYLLEAGLSMFQVTGLYALGLMSGQLLIGSEFFTIPLTYPEGTIRFTGEEYDALVKKLSGPTPLK